MNRMRSRSARSRSRGMLAGALAVAALGSPASLRAGELTAWGNDVFGQTSGTPTGFEFVSVVAGGWHGYALRADGTIAAWGNDDSGQVSNTPSGSFVAVAAGGFTGYALAADGSISAWGYNGMGQVLNAPTGTGFVAIAGGYDHAYALRSNGSIVAWGENFEGQVSGAPAGVGFKAIAAGEEHGYALRADGSIAAWGRDADGEVSGTPGGTGFLAIAAGGHNGYALAADGTLHAWGANNFGQVSNLPAGTFTAVAAGGFGGAALTSDGSIVAWGLSADGTPVEPGFQVVVAGRHHGYGLRLARSFCGADDGADLACPCANPGAPFKGCDLPQGTGGVGLRLAAQRTSPMNRVTWTGSGFPTAGSPASIVLRAPGLDPSSPTVFGDGVRCIGIPVVRLGATLASGGTVTHTHGHGAGAGSGPFFYQLWFRSTPISFCDPTAAFNLSNGLEIDW